MKVNDFPKVTVILRGYTYDQIHTVVKNLIGTELKAVEITMNTPGALETIRKIREEFGDSILVGAGTVLTYTEAQQAIDAGAAFLLSPTVFDQVLFRYPGASWQTASDGSRRSKCGKSGRIF